MTDAERCPTSEIARAAAAHEERTGRYPQYVVLDADSFLWCFRGMPRPEQDQRNGQCVIMGMIAVVIDTDGLPMVRVADWPFEQSLRAERPNEVRHP